MSKKQRKERRKLKKYHRGDSADYALSEHQVVAALKACQDLIDRIIIKCLIFLGLRASELVHMNATWVTQEGNLRIPRSQKCNCAECARHPKHPGEWWTKTQAGERVLHIPERLRKDLSELLKAQPYGLGLSRQAVWYRVKTILKRANVKFQDPAGKTGFPHAMRATCATILAASDKMNEFELCYYMGWADINMAKHYVQIARTKPGAMQKAKEIFG